jgi:DNA-binding LytR/AlgR family response regulator
MNLRSIIVDDEPIARKLLQEYIGDIHFLELKGSFDNPLKADAFLSHESVDLMFLDINMPKISGIEYLRSSGNLPMVIMTTAYAEHALTGFELDVMDYLVKPFSFERFLKACMKAKEYLELKNQPVVGTDPGGGYFFVKCDNRIEKIFYDELIYVEAMLNYVTLHTTRGKMMVYLTMKGILEQLPSPVFLKVHKSVIVNISKIVSMEGNEINLGTAKVVISQGLFDTAMKLILKDKMIKR